jgi:excisionase family DNA binding protein
VAAHAAICGAGGTDEAQEQGLGVTEIGLCQDAGELLPIREAAVRVGVSRDTVSGWVAGGLLSAVRVGTRRCIRIADLAAAREVAHAGGAVPAWREDPRRTGETLRAIREAAGMSQLRLAAVSGVAHELVSRLERGVGTPRAGTVWALARSLGIAPERFVEPGPIGLTLLTTLEAASALGVPAARMQKWLRRGVLPGTKISGEWRVPAVAVAELDRSGRLRGRSRRLDPRYRG